MATRSLLRGPISSKSTVTASLFGVALIEQNMVTEFKRGIWLAVSCEESTMGPKEDAWKTALSGN